MKPISIEVCIKNILMQEGIGDIIRKELDRKGVKPSHFAEKMGFGRSNATNLLNRKDWPFSKIMQACEVLESNLFYYIIPSYENKDFHLLKESMSEISNDVNYIKTVNVCFCVNPEIEWLCNPNNANSFLLESITSAFFCIKFKSWLRTRFKYP